MYFENQANDLQKRSHPYSAQLKPTQKQGKIVTGFGNKVQL